MRFMLKMENRMCSITESRRGQITLEAGVILLYILIMLTTFWLGGPVQQSTERGTDTNNVMLAAQALDTLASYLESAGMSGTIVRKDFSIHVPFDTVDIRYGNGSYWYNGTLANGPHMNMTILLYNNISGIDVRRYYADNRGDPSWHYRIYDYKGPSETAFYYVNVTQPLGVEIDSFPFCMLNSRKNASETRGGGTRFIFIDKNNITRSIRFCCEAGFNLQLYMERSLAEPDKISVRARRYYSLPGEWKLTP